MKPPVVRDLDDKHSDTNATPWNHHLRRSLWRVQRDRCLVERMRKDMAARGQQINGHGEQPLLGIKP